MGTNQLFLLPNRLEKQASTIGAHSNFKENGQEHKAKIAWELYAILVKAARECVSLPWWAAGEVACMLPPAAEARIWTFCWIRKGMEAESPLCVWMFVRHGMEKWNERCNSDALYVSMITRQCMRQCTWQNAWTQNVAHDDEWDSYHSQVQHKVIKTEVFPMSAQIKIQIKSF